MIWGLIQCPEYISNSSNQRVCAILVRSNLPVHCTRHALRYHILRLNRHDRRRIIRNQLLCRRIIRITRDVRQVVVHYRSCERKDLVVIHSRFPCARSNPIERLVNPGGLLEPTTVDRDPQSHLRAGDAIAEEVRHSGVGANSSVTVVQVGKVG